MVTIRDYKSDDKVAILALMDEFQQYIEKVDDLERTKYKPQAAKYFLDKILKRTEEGKGVVYVAEKEAKVVGFIAAHVDGQDGEEQMEAIPATPGIISEFFVTESCRGKGVGKNLLSKAENYLRGSGCSIIRLCVFAPNKPTRIFYQHTGYVDRLVWVMKEVN